MKLMVLLRWFMLGASLGSCDAKPEPAVPGAGDKKPRVPSSWVDGGAPATQLDAGGEHSDPNSLSDCARACTNLRLLKCEEGFENGEGETCLRVCERTEASHLTDLRPACLAKARNRTELAKCGTVRCLTVKQ